MIRFLDRLLDGIIILFLTGVFLIGAYLLYDTLYVYSGASFRGSMIYKPESAGDAASLKALSEDVVAWINISDTGVDFPVMQGDSNSEYLNRDPYGEYAVSGSIFLDVRNRETFSDPYNILYGHHMEGGLMFGALDAFADEAFFDAHREGTLVTTGQKKYRLEVFAYGEGNAFDAALFDLDRKVSVADRLEELRKLAIYYCEPASRHVIALTTCKHAVGEERTFVLCAMVPVEGEMER